MEPVYDKVFIGKNEYPFVKGKDNLKADFIKWFPSEEKSN